MRDACAPRWHRLRLLSELARCDLAPAKLATLQSACAPARSEVDGLLFEHGRVAVLGWWHAWTASITLVRSLCVLIAFSLLAVLAADRRG
jgi:hypothetical protein